MSKVKITGHASGTGVLTVTAPNTSSDRTITLPDSTGTLLDENSSLPAANLTGTIADARLPDPLPAIDGSSLTGITTGKVLQVVSVAVESGSTWVNTLAHLDVLQTLSITPSSASSKVLVLCSLGMSKSGTGYTTLALFRGATRRNNFGNTFGYDLDNNEREHMSVTFLDSPGVNTSVTYNIMANGVVNGGSTTFYQHASTITLIEVGA